MTAHWHKLFLTVDFLSFLSCLFWPVVMKHTIGRMVSCSR